MVFAFKKPPTESRQALKEWGIPYKNRWDGTLFVPGQSMVRSGYIALRNLNSAWPRGMSGTPERPVCGGRSSGLMHPSTATPSALSLKPSSSGTMT
ncbi:MAG: hypothetical protein JWO19_2288 [Bryobacterales bacterium]|nr:hypothetical protein [Bryobacterales bacterium]